MLPAKGRGGIHSHINAVGELLSQRQIPVTVVHPASWSPVLALGVLNTARALRYTGSETGVRWDRLWHRVLLELAMRRELRSTARTVVYAQDPRSAYAAIRANRRRAATVVMAVHYNGSQADELVERGQLAPGGKTEQSIRAFEAGVIARLDGIVYVSDFMQQRIHRDVPEAKAVPSAVIPNFLPQLPEQRPASDSTLRDCISVGYLSVRKNHAYLLRVLAAARVAGNVYT
nr:glycosyltransferase [Propionibacteriales bacterium]